jgi:hypothetical protein
MSVLVGERRSERQPHDEHCSRRDCYDFHGSPSDLSRSNGRTAGPAPYRGEIPRPWSTESATR